MDVTGCRPQGVALPTFLRCGGVGGSGGEKENTKLLFFKNTRIENGKTEAILCIVGFWEFHDFFILCIF